MYVGEHMLFDLFFFPPVFPKENKYNLPQCSRVSLLKKESEAGPAEFQFR